MKTLFAAAFGSFLIASQAVAGLPLPPFGMPEDPPLLPMVVTAGGQKLLLQETDVAVRWDPEAEQLVSTHPGWWVINYPFDRIEGLEERNLSEIGETLFGRPRDEVKNWYLRTPPTESRPVAEEPPEPKGPAPIEPHPSPTFVVDQRHPEANDENPGNLDAPLKTIQAAVARAQPGDAIQVRPGVYRERIQTRTAGTKERPIVLEGVRDADGRMPAVSGNDAAPENAWSPVWGRPGLWRAEHWVAGPAALALDGRNLRERTILAELGPGEFLQNRGDWMLVDPPVDGSIVPRPGERQFGAEWRRVDVDENGQVQLGEERGIFILSSWIWLHPRGEEEGEVWDPRFPAPITGQVWTLGGFRAARQSGAPFRQQLNPYRLWLNGELMPGVGEAGRARANTDIGREGDHWTNLPFREGWNHVVLLMDSTFRENLPNAYRFRVPRGHADTVSSAVKPDDLTRPIEGSEHNYFREWMVLGPLPADRPDRALYLKLDPNEDPNEMDFDLGARVQLAALEHPHWTVRGLEFRHGAQTQQQPQMLISAPGVTIEYCDFIEPEVRSISFALRGFQQEDLPIVARGNWIRSPGQIGMGAQASSNQLTVDNLNNPPGRGRILIEHNTILDNNRGGYERFHESGGMKFFRLTRAINRHNTVLGGDGPGIWYDWEHYYNRVEGNRIERTTGFGIGMEASPGPNLVASNVIVDLQPAVSIFASALMGWDSSRTWKIHNTVDNARSHPADGLGMRIGEITGVRGTRWDDALEPEAAAINNLIFNSSVAFDRTHLHPVEGNLFFDHGGPFASGDWIDPDLGAVIEQSGQIVRDTPLPEFNNPPMADYRTAPGSLLDGSGVTETFVDSGIFSEEVEVVSLVRHDFFGLLRHPEDGRSPGAFRIERDPANEETMQLEAEFADGAMVRYWRAAD